MSAFGSPRRVCAPRDARYHRRTGGQQAQRMTVYRVMFRGEGLVGTFDGVETPCGFFKNEYVWSKDPAEAVSKAKRNVERALERKSFIRRDALADVRLDVDEIEAGANILDPLRREGFLFHKLDS